MLSYNDYPKYKDMSDNQDHYLKNVKVITFYIILNFYECRGDLLKNSYKDYNTINSEHLKNYPKEEEEKIFICCFPF